MRLAFRGDYQAIGGFDNVVCGSEMELIWTESSRVIISWRWVLISGLMCMPSHRCWTTTCFPCDFVRSICRRDQNNEWAIFLGHFRWYVCLNYSANSLNTNSRIQQMDQPIKILVWSVCLATFIPNSLNLLCFRPIFSVGLFPGYP